MQFQSKWSAVFSPLCSILLFIIVIIIDPWIHEYIHALHQYLKKHTFYLIFIRIFPNSISLSFPQKKLFLNSKNITPKVKRRKKWAKTHPKYKQNKNIILIKIYRILLIPSFEYRSIYKIQPWSGKNVCRCFFYFSHLFISINNIHIDDSHWFQWSNDHHTMYRQTFVKIYDSI